MNTSYSTDIIAWIVAVLATLIVRGVAGDATVQLAPTLFACGVAGAVWLSFRALSRRLTRGLPARSLSATLAIGSAIGAGVVTLLVIVALDIPAARGVVAVALALAGIGWGLASDLRAFRHNAQIA